MHNVFDLARSDINHNALREAIGNWSRREYAPIEESLPESLAALAEQVEQTLRGEGE
jgi:hypothetical protein